MLDEKDVLRCAKANGWQELPSKDPYALMFYRVNGGNHERINVWAGKGTVGTYISHPKQGKTQLFRRHVTLNELGKIFQNPRYHTNKGYR